MFAWRAVWRPSHLRAPHPLQNSSLFEFLEAAFGTHEFQNDNILFFFSREKRAEGQVEGLADWVIELI